MTESYWHAHQYWPSPPDASRATEILQRVGLYHLAGYDGCLCCGCELLGFHIRVSCYKSSGRMKPVPFRGNLIRVWSNYLDLSVEALGVVADEVARQVHASAEHTPIAVRFTDYEHDADQTCVYCNKKRSKPLDYICEECRTKTDPFGCKIADRYDYSRLARKVKRRKPSRAARPTAAR